VDRQECSKVITHNFIFFATYVVLKNVPDDTLVLGNTKHFNHLHSFKEVPVQLYISASDCKVVGNIYGSYFLKDFSDLPSNP
jgi:hypothetical protein